MDKRRERRSKARRILFEPVTLMPGESATVDLQTGETVISRQPTEPAETELQSLERFYFAILAAYRNLPATVARDWTSEAEIVRLLRNSEGTIATLRYYANRDALNFEKICEYETPGLREAGFSCLLEQAADRDKDIDDQQAYEELRNLVNQIGIDAVLYRLQAMGVSKSTNGSTIVGFLHCLAADVKIERFRRSIDDARVHTTTSDNAKASDFTSSE